VLQALLWDVDGTLAETERDGHRVAFNRAFEAMNLPWRWDEARYGELLRVTGGRERLLADMAGRADAPVLADEREALARELHRRKNAVYAELVRGGEIPLRAGVLAVIEAAAARGLRQGIVTTTSRVNVDALLTRHFGARWAGRFAVVVSGEDVAAKKPSPECYRRALDALRVTPLAALAIEDSCSGATAARAADVPVVVTRSACFAADIVDQAVAIGPGLHTRRGWQPALAEAGDAAVTLDDLVDWHARMEWVGAHG
jgi:HAD superfamily hydrolase (TIGR01509 family)